MLIAHNVFMVHQKHERMVAEKVVWSRQRSIREEMLQLLTRLHSMEKQRRHFDGQGSFLHTRTFWRFISVSSSFKTVPGISPKEFWFYIGICWGFYELNDILVSPQYIRGYFWCFHSYITLGKKKCIKLSVVKNWKFCKDLVYSFHNSC